MSRSTGRPFGSHVVVHGERHPICLDQLREHQRGSDVALGTDASIIGVILISGSRRSYRPLEQPHGAIRGDCCVELRRSIPFGAIHAPALARNRIPSGRRSSSHHASEGRPWPTPTRNQNNSTSLIIGFVIPPVDDSVGKPRLGGWRIVGVDRRIPSADALLRCGTSEQADKKMTIQA